MVQLAAPDHEVRLFSPSPPRAPDRGPPLNPSVLTRTPPHPPPTTLSVLSLSPSRFFGTVCVATTIAMEFNIVDPFYLVLDWGMVFKKFQVSSSSSVPSRPDPPLLPR